MINSCHSKGRLGLLPHSPSATVKHRSVLSLRSLLAIGFQVISLAWVLFILFNWKRNLITKDKKSDQSICLFLEKKSKFTCNNSIFLLQIHTQFISQVKLPNLVLQSSCRQERATQSLQGFD